MVRMANAFSQLVKLAFPPQCIGCGAVVETDNGLCGTCWKDVPFLRGLVCDSCGVPLPGQTDEGHTKCDDCMSLARGWERGRAAVVYTGMARKLVLSLKHGDRLDLVEPLADWMAVAVEPLLDETTLVVPIPLHPMRLIRRRYNQAALLGQALAYKISREFCPDALRRVRQTRAQEGMSLEDRFANQAQAFHANRRVTQRLAGRSILLVDDVMTSGATFSGATEACYAAGAKRVDVLALARAVKEPYV